MTKQERRIEKTGWRTALIPRKSHDLAVQSPDDWHRFVFGDLGDIELAKMREHLSSVRERTLMKGVANK